MKEYLIQYIQYMKNTVRKELLKENLIAKDKKVIITTFKAEGILDARTK